MPYPGLANRMVAGAVYRALVGFEATGAWFPRAERSHGLAGAREFFDDQAEDRRQVHYSDYGRKPGGAHSEPRSRESWRSVREGGSPIRIHSPNRCCVNTKPGARVRLKRASKEKSFHSFATWRKSLESADLVVSRSGAGTFNEIAAAACLRFWSRAVCGRRSSAPKRGEIRGRGRGAHGTRQRDERRASVPRVELLRQNPETLAAMRQRVRPFANLARPSAPPMCSNGAAGTDDNQNGRFTLTGRMKAETIRLTNVF